MLFEIGKAVPSPRAPANLSVSVDTQRVINGHGMFLGKSGMGKTHRIRDAVAKLCQSAGELQRGIRFHVMDVHEDIHIAGASEVLFSQSTQWGFNPLEINPDPHFGGVNRAIQEFIGALSRQKVLGSKQEAVIRYMLQDLYSSRGFHANDSSSWIPDSAVSIKQMLAGKENRIYLDVKFDHRERFKSLIRDESGAFIGGWDKELNCWWVESSKYSGDLLMWSPRILFKTSPTVDDLVEYAQSKLKALLVGGNGAAMALLTEHTRAAALFHRRASELAKKGDGMEESERNQALQKLQGTRVKAVASFDSFLQSVETGRELDDLIRYNSADVLKSVYERLQNLKAIGIFRSGTPPFNPRSPIWRYKIKSLGVPEQRLFVEVVLRRIFDRAMQRGEQSDIVEVIVLDEASRFAYDDEDNILNTISNEARKFGLALWCGAQSPNQFSDAFIKNVSFKIVLGLADGDIQIAARKLGMDPALHSSVIPKHKALVQIQNEGELQTPFVVTVVQ